MTNVFQKLKDANLTVVVHNLKNEYTTLAFDYWSDPDVKIATYIQTAKVDGIVTDFLATASRFMSELFHSKCLFFILANYNFSYCMTKTLFLVSKT